MHGLIVVDKGEGFTSARAIDPVKRALRMRKRVGHAGTLDPFATGVLIVLFGDVTRLTESLIDLPKVYHATVIFGEQTDTLDIDGEVVERADPGTSAPAELESVLREFVGEIEQVPPAHSALKVGGRPAYKLARKGRAPALAPRQVMIHEIRLLRDRWPLLDLEVVCGTGTYIRALARDLGDRLGLPAGLNALRRTAIGPFLAKDGVRIDKYAEIPRRTILSAIQPPLVIPRVVGLEEFRLSFAEARVFIRGNTVKLTAPLEPGKTYALLDDTGEFLMGIGKINPDGSLRPKKVLPHAVDEILRRME